VKIWQKIALIVITFSVPLALVSYLFLAANTENGELAKRELAELEEGQLRRALVDHLLRQRELNKQAAQADEAVQNQLNANAAAIEADLKAIEARDQNRVGVLETRINLAQGRTGLEIGVLVVGLLGGFSLLYLFLRRFNRQNAAIQRVFQQIAVGNFQARAAVSTNDELGQIASNLNDYLLPLVTSHDDRTRLQESITKLLEEVSGVAEGDLTREAEVTADATGAIADSFNYMIEQLRQIISNVQGATFQVTTSANQIQETATTLVEGSETQAQQIVQTTTAIDQMAASIHQVSRNAGNSSEVARQALTNARNGTEAVQNTIQGMNRIRDQVQETAKRIKRLGESSQEIGQITQLIDDIADRTSILALNASIQAAMAGEAGRGFAVVAEEVERLAVRSTEATKKIATLVKTIQGETNEAVAAMEKGIHEVVEGSKLANQAGHALGEIEGVSNKLAELIESITQAAKEQARSSEALVKSMGEISQITQETTKGTRQTAESVTGLAALADDLRSSLSTFRLPNAKDSRWDYGNGHGNGNSPARNILRPQSAPVVFVDN
jgi:methyl-accepting chemotaxis protein